MKRYFLYSIFLCLGLSGCKKFLGTQPTDFLTPDDYYNTESKLMSALAGAYQPLSSAALYGDAMFFYLGCGTDECFRATASSTSGAWVYNYDYTEPYVNGMWATLYVGIERANQLIKNIDLAPMDDTKRKAILGEALFLRGYYYFMLVSTYGDVPLQTKPTASPSDITRPRTPAREVYAQILDDMQKAENYVYTSTSLGYSSRVSKTAVEGVLARVCLTMAGYPLLDNSKYADALKWASKVQASGEHYLISAAVNPDGDNNSGYSQVFVNEMQEKYDVHETMWEAEQKGNRTDGYTSNGRLGNDIGIGYTAPNYADSGYCYGTVRITERLYKLYGKGDLRRDWNIGAFSYNAAGARVYYAANKIYDRCAAKWRRTYETLTPKDKNYTGTNFPLLRYADVLLMLAEAENQVNGPTQTAYDAINMVRRRGYGLPVNTPSAVADLPAGLGQQAFLQAIQDERARELCFETFRRPDLIRWGIFIPTMKAVAAEFKAYNGTYAYGAIAGNNVSEKHLLYPIPSNEISVNKAAVQNPGW
ncbi:RagB/SusD family nutrient uptake outer membrane protein [Chitinophaga qingshengii]|uniref:RagB/SusD family nutrient uptake outer membrane protein n=1 Tax=Chitinophaga qingshengii TaxID=1569794 RepID=A0ABR7TH78_9BACT|nr:RagB/SusD family nutrient uptake outer membrane protein [Chitinophaga qingshengii]MBC9929841.1 RagB/SusD family nutrient uptake outer membrane protein [Chitinophaga qingshengii]